MRRLVKVLAVAVSVLAAAITIALVTNPAPAVPAIAARDVTATTPYVVKLHARWCAICLTTKGAWASVQEQYTGKVRFVVFDFTSDATTAASREEALRLGLTSLFDERVGETGTVLVLNGRSKEILHDLHGHRSADEFRAAIDETLAAPAAR